MANISTKSSIAAQAKTKAQLLAELNELRQRVAQLEAAAAESKGIEQALQASEARFKAVFDCAGVGIALIDPNGPILQSNPALQQMLGYSAAELSQPANLTITHPDDRALTKARMADLLTGRLDSIHIEKRYLHKNGQTVWVDLSTTSVRSEQGRVVALVGAMVDITARKLVEASLRQTEARLRAVLGNNEIVVFDQDQDLRYTQIYNPNPNFTVESVLGKTDADLLSPIEAVQLTEIKRRVLTTGVGARQDVQTTLGGETFYYDLTVEPKLDSTGQVVGLSCAAMNITERQQAVIALAESEYKYRQLVEQSNDAIILTDETGKLSEWNGAAERIIGLQQSEILGQTLWEALFRVLPAELQTPERYEQLKSEWLTYFQTGQHPSLNQAVELEIQHPDGSRRMVQTSRFSIKTERGYLLGAVIRDVTEHKRLEAALQESRERLEMALQGAKLGTWDWHVSSGAVVFNERWAEMLGYTLAEIEPNVGSWEKLLHPEDVAVVMAAVNAHLEGRTPLYQTEHRLRSKSGEWKWILDTGQVFERDAQGQPVRVVGIHQDITQRKQAEIALSESEARYRSLFQNNLDAVTLSTPDGRILDTNPAACAMYGYTGAEFRQLGRADLVDTTDPRLPLAMEERTRTGKFVGELTHLRRDGTSFPVEVSTVVFPDQNGELKTYVIARDITERKRAEEALRASEAKFRQIIEKSGDGFMLADETGQIVEWNPRLEQITGLARAEAVGRTGWQVRFELLPTEHRTPTMYEQIKTKAQAYFQTGQDPQLNQISHLEIERGDGSYRDLQEMPFSIQSKAGFWRSNIIRDITEQKQAERVETAQLAVSQILAESPKPETALRQILEAIATGLEWDLAKLWWLDSSGSHLVWRAGWRTPDQPELAKFDRLSQSYTFAPGEGFAGTVWQAGQALWDQDLRLVKDTSAALAVGLHSATGIPIIQDGVTVGVMVFFSRSARPLEERLLTVLTDLGRQIGHFLARKEAEETLRRYEQMVSTSPDLLSLVDHNYVYRIINQTYLSLINKTYEQIVDHPVTEVLGEAMFSEVIKPRIDQGLAGETVQYQAWFDFPAGGQRFLDVTYTPYREKEGTITGVVVSGRDITEAKLLEEHLQQVQKMGVIGQLSAGMAHHYNSMLTAIIGYTSLSLHTLPPGDPLARNLNRVLTTAEQMAVLVRQLLAFAQKQLLQPKTVSLSELVLKLQPELQQLAPPSVDFTLHLAPEVGQVKVDLRQFEYLLQALVSNAVDAMPEGGRLTLTTRTVSLGEVEAGWYDLSPGDYALLTVQDTGLGLTDEVKAHLFEPFFTTKEVGAGTGLGLAMSLGIAKQHGGHLLADSQLGQGSTFRLYLPLVAAPPPPISPAPATDFTIILLVESTPGVRKLMTEILTKEGYTVLAAADSPTALQLVTDQPERWPHLLLVPADLNSRGLVQRLRASHPGLKVIFLVDQGDEVAAETEAVAFLAKPFKPSGLLQKVWAMLA